MSGGCMHTPVCKIRCWEVDFAAREDKARGLIAPWPDLPQEDVLVTRIAIALTDEYAAGLRSGFDSGDNARDSDCDRAYTQAWEEALSGMEDYIAESRAILKRSRQRNRILGEAK